MDTLAERKLTYAKGWTIFTYIASALFFAVGLSLFYLAYDDDKQKLFMILLGLGIILFSVYCSAAMYRTYIMVYHDSIAYSSLFRKRKLFFKDIKGYRLNGKYLTIIPLQKNDSKIAISDITYFAGYQHIRYVLHYNVPNLDTIDYKEEIEAISYDNRIGINDTHRLKRLGIAKKIVTGLTIVCLLLIVVSVYFLPLSDALITALLFFPLICFVVMRYYKGIIRFDGREHGAYPTIGGVIMLNSIGLLLKALLDVSIYDYTNLWYTVGLVAVICYVLLNRLTLHEPKINSKTTHILLMLLIALPFAYGSVAVVDCYYDLSKPVVYKAKVLKKDFTVDKIVTYHLTLTAWGNHDTGEEETVPHQLYNQVNEKDSVKVLVKKGLLDIPWYTITTN